MAFLSIIRRWGLREQLSIREIARRTGLSRNTIRKYLRTGAVEPKFAVSDRPSKLDAFALKLAGWLKTEAGKSQFARWSNLSGRAVVALRIQSGGTVQLEIVPAVEATLRVEMVVRGRMDSNEFLQSSHTSKM